MADFPTVQPWRIPTGRIDRSRIIVVANTDVSWSLSECEYYCAARGIPLTNIIAIALGNGGSPTVTASIWNAVTAANVIATIFTPLGAKARAMYATGVLLGPGVPVGCQFPNETGTPKVAAMTDVMAVAGWPGENAYAPGTPWTASELHARDLGSGFIIAACGASFYIQLGRTLTNWSYCFPGATPYTPTNEPLSDAYNWPLTSIHALPDTSLRFSSLPTYGATQSIGHPVYHWGAPASLSSKAACAPGLPVGRIGFASLGGGTLSSPPYAETQAIVRDLVDRTTALMESHRQGEAIRKPVLFNLTEVDGGIKSAVKWSYLRWLCEQWGIVTKYAYKNAAGTDAEALGYSPTVSQVYDGAAMTAGSVVDQDYYMMVGGWDNIDFNAAPYANAWKPLPGAGVLMGPSNGFQASNRALERGAICCKNDAVHTITNAINNEPVVFHNLLRGMTWLEAFFFGGCSGSYPCGDPLWAPYGFDDVYIPRKSRIRRAFGPRLRSQ